MSSNHDKDQRRILASVLGLLGIPGLMYCGLYHNCSCGFHQHPPYPVWQIVGEMASLACIVAGAVFSIQSNMRQRYAYCIALAWLALLRATCGVECSGLALMVFIVIVAVRGLLGSGTIRREGFCRTCDYDLTGNMSGICPECGTKIESTKP